MTPRGPFQPLTFCDSVWFCDSRERHSWIFWGADSTPVISKAWAQSPSEQVPRTYTSITWSIALGSAEIMLSPDVMGDESWNPTSQETAFNKPGLCWNFLFNNKDRCSWLISFLPPVGQILLADEHWQLQTNHKVSWSGPATHFSISFLLPDIFNILGHNHKGNFCSGDQSNLQLVIVYHYDLSHRTILRSQQKLQFWLISYRHGGKKCKKPHYVKYRKKNTKL